MSCGCDKKFICANDSLSNLNGLRPNLQRKLMIANRSHLVSVGSREKIHLVEKGLNIGFLKQRRQEQRKLILPLAIELQTVSCEFQLPFVKPGPHYDASISNNVKIRN